MPRDLTAALDQLRSALRDAAQVLGEYRRALHDQGFDPDEALEMCLEVQRGILFADLQGDG